MTCESEPLVTFYSIKQGGHLSEDRILRGNIWQRPVDIVGRGGVQTQIWNSLLVNHYFSYCEVAGGGGQNISILGFCYMDVL